MTKKLKWRLSELPTPLELATLVTDGLLSKDEARQILFSEEDEELRDKKSLESEIKFLRELVQKLSDGKKTEIVRVFQDVYIPYAKQPWIAPYQYFCGVGVATSGLPLGTITSAANANYSVNTTSSDTSTMLYNRNSIGGDFTTIKTF